MFDPGAVQQLLKQLNRWYRAKAKPNGLADLYHRGVRMQYTRACRVVTTLFTALMVAGGLALLWLPPRTHDPGTIIFLKFMAAAMIVLGLGAWLQVFRSYAVVNDDGLVAGNLFGRQSRLAWGDIRTFEVKSDSNKVIFRDKGRRKLALSLSYDGWLEFREFAGRRLNPSLYLQLVYTLNQLRAKPAPSKPAFWPKWLNPRRP